MLGLVAMLLVAGVLGLIFSLTGTVTKEWRNDVAPFVSRFPEFAKAPRVRWKAGHLDEGSFFDGLGPAIYWMRGYVFLSDGEAQILRQQYSDWKSSRPDISAEDRVDDGPEATASWRSSSELNVAMSPGTYDSRFFLCDTLPVAYFETMWDGSTLPGQTSRPKRPSTGPPTNDP